VLVSVSILLFSLAALAYWLRDTVRIILHHR
jgi:hypothetical protein